MELFLQRLFDALANGAIYASLGLALAIIYKSTGHLNFAQGEMAMFSAFIVYVLSVEQNWPVVLAIIVTVLIAATFGALMEGALVRPLERRNPLTVVIISLGLFLILNSVASRIWYGNPRQFDSPYPDPQLEYIEIGGARLPWATIGYWATVLGAAGLLWLLLQKTKVGLAFRSVASNRESARLVGIEVNRTLMLGWALAAAVGALSGVIAASSRPLFDANLMLPLLIYAFAAVLLGGFDSMAGAIVGGVLIALIETMAGGYLDFVGSELGQTTALAVIVVVLLFRPSGLFGSRKVQRV
jgi:branched-chain amino acid transport system permease protein